MAPDLPARARFAQRISENDPRLHLYAILDCDTCARLGLAITDVAKAWRDAGIALVQYREKSSQPAQVLQNALRIRQVFAGTDSFLILNDSVDLAVQAGFDGVHLGQSDGATGPARSVLGPDRILGRSTHTAAQVQQANHPEIDYLAIGPIFSTMSKTDAEPVVGLDGVRTVRALTRKPLVGIGGVTLARCASVRAAGVDCVAAISALTAPSSTLGLEATAQDFLAALK